MTSPLTRLLLPAVLLAGFVLACGQEDPTFRPDGGGTAAKGRIFVTSTVPGARISLDGADAGIVTPDTLREIDPGTHRVGVLLAGFYPPEEQTLEVEADSVHQLSFELVAIAQVGRVWVTAPFPAAILLDGSPTGFACPDTLEGVAPGAHVVTLVLPGFRSDPGGQPVDVVAGETADADFALVVDKMVVCEDFSNYACVPCPPADAALQQAMDEVGREHVVSVNPHVNFPGQGDPFFAFNQNSNNARIFFNQVGVAPTILVDGTRVPQTEIESPAMVKARIQVALGQPAPIALGVRSRLTATAFEVAIDVWGVAGGIPSDLLLFVWVVEGEAVLNPAGPNGQSNYTNVLRQLYPVPASGSTGGEALGALVAGDHRHFDYVFDLPAGIDPAQLRAVAFAQRSPQRTVVQAGVSFAIP